MKFGRTRLWVSVTCAALFVVLVSPAHAAKPPPPPNTSGAVFYWFAGVEWCPSSSVVSSWGGSRGGDIALGRFGPNGKVVDGDAVMVLALDIGSAPVSSLAMPAVTDDATGSQLYVSPDRRSATGVVNSSGLNWNNGLGLQPQVNTLAEGEGTATVRIALLTRRGQSWKSAPGVTVPLRVIVGNCVGAYNPQTETPLTIGGGWSKG